MRLVTYDVDGGRPRAGLLVDDAIVDAATSAADAGLDSGVARSSVKAIIGAASDEQRGALQAAARDRRATSGLPVDGVTLHPPVPDPEKVLCIGLN